MAYILLENDTYLQRDGAETWQVYRYGDKSTNLSTFPTAASHHSLSLLSTNQTKNAHKALFTYLNVP